MSYNPSIVAQKGTMFGLPYSLEEAEVVLIPVPLDVTVSYHEGTAKAPNLILNESTQLDLSLCGIVRPWELKIAMDRGEPIVDLDEHSSTRRRAKKIMRMQEEGKVPSPQDIEKVNAFCRKVHHRVTERCEWFLAQGKRVGVVGGDHSSALGLLRSLASTQSFGILQVDAHMDLRKSYGGFDFSHASVIYNALLCEKVMSLTQVGVRDFCEEEEKFIQKSEKKIHVYYEEVLFRAREGGKSWDAICHEIVETLPQCVYVSFDVDGLDPTLCPSTGTPVPGGLGFNESVFLLEKIVRSGRVIIGFDVCETGAEAWDASVAARILFRLASLCGVADGRLSFR